jgi:formate hydrogenlyase subunit 3/multisubunit Na+/H+ antiporter MnhD subunit
MSMPDFALALAVLAPLALLAALLAPGATGVVRRLLPLASVPAGLAALGPGDGLALPAALLGARLALDDVGRAVLLLIGLAWSAAGWFAADRIDGHFRRFAAFWLATLAGSVLAALAADLATFYAGYVAMTLAAWGLVVHEGDAAARRAARVYLVLALAGEGLLLAGLLMVGARVGNAALAELPAALQGGEAALAGGLMLAGFGVKLAIVPLHVWLPLAHPVAPVPASAILSGVLVKAGLLGALRTVPAAPFAEAPAVTLLLVLGLATAVHGAAMGLAQARLKTVLAYSTVSQLGLLTLALALALGPGAERGGPLVVLLVLHHGLNKAALFLAAGCAPGATRWRLLLLALPALSIAGVPPSTGELAKAALKHALEDSAVAGWAASWLVLSSLLTALLMLHVFDVARRTPPHGAPPPVHPAWCVSVLLGATVPWLQAARDGLARWPGVADAASALWPAALAVVLALAWRRLGPRASSIRIPEGDLIVPAEAAVRALGRLARPIPQGAATLAAHALRQGERAMALARRAGSQVRRAEAGMASVPAAGVVVLVLAGLAAWALA